VIKFNSSNKYASNTTFNGPSGDLKFPVKDIDMKTGAKAPYIKFTVYKSETGIGTPKTDPQYEAMKQGFKLASTSETAKIAAMGLGSIYAGAKVGQATGYLATLPVVGPALYGTTVLTGAAAGGAATGLAEDAMSLLFNNTDVGGLLKQSLENFTTSRNTTTPVRNISLVMPEGIAVSYDHDYDTISATNAFGTAGGVLQAISTMKEGSSENMDPYILEAASKIGEDKIFKGEGAKKLTFYGSTGLVVNPKLEVIYNSPQLRTFTFDFRLVPRNADDSNRIAQIIKAFKFHAAPDIPSDIASGRYFIPPDQFIIGFYYGENDTQYSTDSGSQHMFQTKNCVLKNISIDYTAGGSGFTTFSDGTPTETRLQLQFQETSILNKSDINKGY
jgi:hypothetical protein